MQDRRPLSEHDARALLDAAPDGVFVEEWVLRHKDGHWVPVEVSANILPDGRWQGIVRDITDSKRLEHGVRPRCRG